MLFLKSAEDVSTVRFFLEGEVLERLLMLDYPMVDFVALKRAALTTPFFKRPFVYNFSAVCLHFLAVLFKFFS